MELCHEQKKFQIVIYSVHYLKNCNVLLKCKFRWVAFKSIWVSLLMFISMSHENNWVNVLIALLWHESSKNEHFKIECVATTRTYLNTYKHDPTAVPYINCGSGVLVHKNSLASCQRCRHSVEPRALTCPFKQSNLSAWSLLSWHPAHKYLWGRLCFDLTKGVSCDTFVITVWYKLCCWDHSVLELESFWPLMYR